MAERTQRLFFALWPEDPVRTRCDWYAGSILGKRRRRVPAANLHITLAFAGEVNDAVRCCLERRADAVRVAPFRLVIDHLGFWQRQQVLWMGPTHTPDEVWSLASTLRAALTACDMQCERHTFQAHMTLARRFKVAIPVVQAPEIEWSVSRFCLVQSVQAEHGVRYRVLRHWPLEGGL